MSQSLEIHRLRRTGRGKHREDAIAKIKAGPMLLLCLSACREEPGRMTQRVAECGILTSKRQVSKSAVVRNRAKRRVRALFAALDLAALESQMARKDIKSIRILVVCQKECVAHPFEILKPKLLAGLEKLIEVVAQTLGEPV